MKSIILLTFVLSVFISKEIAFAKNGDTINIISHNKTKVVTDPSKGFNAYTNWSLFPAEETKYRKAVLYVTYQCPDSQQCGEWDYIDNIFLRRKGSLNDTALGIELARMISPYGSKFTPDWKFTWKTDITDFSFLLHDSVEIEFNHTGYESNTDRGWLITLRFELTEGPPVMEVLGFEKLWTGKFPYGDINDDIKNYLTPYQFENKYESDIARLRILQTGHGMDDFENCAEFCSKYREIFYDDNLIEKKQIWRECGDNPLYPQAGTWIFDRAGWCPGAIVDPDIYDLNISDSYEHSLDIEMEKYVNPNKPSANYVFSSYLFYYKKPAASNDVSIEEIISPGAEDIYSRQNPACNFPEIKIKNNGTEQLTSLIINFGLKGEEMEFLWNGKIEPLTFSGIVLPGIISGNSSASIFSVKLSKPNGYTDEYQYDNQRSSVFIDPPVFDPKFILKIKTNNESSQNYYQLINGKKFILRQKAPGELEDDKLYQDTIRLRSGCYEFVFGDTANDGLDFWYNEAGGYGYVRVTDTAGHLIKAFNSDFGKEIRQQFMVTGKPVNREDITPILNIFPPRNSGKFVCDIFLNEKQNVTLEITSEDKKKIVFKKKIKKFKEGIVDVDISKEKEGVYFVNITANKKTVSRKMKLKKN